MSYGMEVNGLVIRRRDEFGWIEPQVNDVRLQGDRPAANAAARGGPVSRGIVLRPLILTFAWSGRQAATRAAATDRTVRAAVGSRSAQSGPAKVRAGQDHRGQQQVNDFGHSVQSRQKSRSDDALNRMS